VVLLLLQTCRSHHPSHCEQQLTDRSGAYFGLGGVLLVLGGIGEWILGKHYLKLIAILQLMPVF
jgi:hypothetical protein